MKNVRECSFFVKEFYDIDEYASGMVAASDVQQLEKGSFHGKVQRIQLGPTMTLTYLATNQRYHVKSAAPSTGVKELGVFFGENVWNKQRVHRDILAYNPGNPMDGVAPSHFQMFVLHVHETLFDRYRSIFGGHAPWDTHDHPGAFMCDTVLLERFRQELRSCFRYLHRNPEAIHVSSFYQRLEADVLQQLLALLIEQHHKECWASSSVKRKAVDETLAYIETFADEVPWGILDICQKINVSKRTLEYAFLEHFGISPKTYLNSYRLNKVYKSLLRASPDSTKVTDVANQWGFWHMGQFAKDYRNFFGELPSETLVK